MSDLDTIRNMLVQETPKSEVKVCLWEACSEQDSGNIGAFYVKYWAEKAGVKIETIRPGSSKTGYDIELVSVHHCTDLPRLANERKHGKIRIIGGHITFSNARPLIPFGDVICLGDGETWIFEAISKLSKKLDINELKELKGTIICKEWKIGDSIPGLNYENPLPKNPPYLNRQTEKNSRWYVEIARGCPYSCSYCELGNSMPYRHYSLEDIIDSINSIDTSKSVKINWFAADESSHPNYNELMDIVIKRGYRQAYGSYRIDQVLKNEIKVSSGQLIRVGVDGLTEETRFRVKKKISNEMIIRYFKTLLQQGHHSFKIFMMFAYPWENLTDFDEFEAVMNSIIPMIAKHKAHLRVKWTPLIPQPCTPLGKEKALYNPLMEIRIKEWHRKIRGFGVECDGIMSSESHQKQIDLTHSNEVFMLKKPKGYINEEWRKYVV
jgi:radical SAM superfamily enzyme YgiQ (UPF0313 family)